VIGLAHVYVLGGVFFAASAWFASRDRSNPKRFHAAAFWGLLAVSFLAGDRLGDLGNGLLVVGLAVVAALGMGRGTQPSSTPEERREGARRHGDRLFAVALIIPAAAFAGTLVAKQTKWGARLIDPAQATLVSLVLGVLLAIGVAQLWLRSGTSRPQPSVPLREGRRLLESVGWAAILPQMLASLGVVFLTSGVGTEVGRLFSERLALDTRFTAVAAYCVGMAAFTMLMGNAFAAFPVMMAGVGIPLLVLRHHANPAVLGAIGMLTGYCGTLLTPMAANFNIVPAVLLELPDQYGVIRAQWPTALILLAVNFILMWWLVFR
jgi:uncharacterized membrane protein